MIEYISDYDNLSLIVFKYKYNVHICGIVAVSGNKDVIHDIYESLTVLETSCQDSAYSQIIMENHQGNH